MKTATIIAAVGIALLCACAKVVPPYILELDEQKPSGIVARGGKIEIKLKANPTTGYAWELSQNGSPYTEFLKEEYEGTNPKLIGSGGVSKFVLEAQQKGHIKLVFTYNRPWEMSAPIKTATFTVDIK